MQIKDINVKHITVTNDQIMGLLGYPSNIKDKKVRYISFTYLHPDKWLAKWVEMEKDGNGS